MKKRANKANCNRGYSCGMSCINVKLMCRQSGLAGQFVSLAEDYFKLAKSAQPKPKYKLAEALTAEEEQALTEAINTNDSHELIYAKSKAKNIILPNADSLDEQEAIAIALWVSDGFGLYTSHLLDENEPNKLNSKDAMRGMAKKLYQAFDKMPKFKPETLADEADFVTMKDRAKAKYYKDFAKDYADGKVDEYYLHRGMSYVPSKYKEELLALKPGDEHEFKVFTATSFDENLADSFGTKVKFKIKPKQSSEGVLVDRYKTQMLESEVLFKPGTKMRVEKAGQSSQIYMDEANKYLDSADMDDITKAGIRGLLNQIHAIKMSKDYSANYERIIALSALKKDSPYALKLEKLAEFLPGFSFKLNYTSKDDSLQIWMEEL